MAIKWTEECRAAQERMRRRVFSAKGQPQCRRKAIIAGLWSPQGRTSCDEDGAWESRVGRGESGMGGGVSQERSSA